MIYLFVMLLFFWAAAKFLFWLHDEASKRGIADKLTDKFEEINKE